jgi:hypothetical protein
MNILKHPATLVVIGIALGYMLSDRIAALPVVNKLPKL